MADEIKSNNQQGGITAHTVNFNTGLTNAPAPAEKPKSKPWKKILIKITAVVAFVASVVAILEYAGVKPEATLRTANSPSQGDGLGIQPNQTQYQQNKTSRVTPSVDPKTPSNTMSDSSKNINVTSYNQSGGITAHTVNMGMAPRQMDAQLARELDLVTTGYKKFTVTCTLGDAEAYGLAAEMMAYLKSKGLSVEGVNQAVWMPPLKGLGMHPQGELLDIQVGSR